MNVSMEECMRWYGPDDSVSLAFIRQAGATGIYTSLHHLPYGEKWPLDQIRERKQLIEDAGMRWVAVESVPVHEQIKTRNGDFQRYIDNYRETIENLGVAGVDLVIYNFMPVLDWVRTDLKYRLNDGTECLHFDPVKFAAFEIYILKRPGAENEYSQAQLTAAKAFYESLDTARREQFTKTIIDVFPGCKLGLTLDDVRNMLDQYKNIDRIRLKENLALFLQEIIPVAEKSGIRLAIHPDDPPYSIMGLPRIMSCEEDVKDLLQMINSPANGLCFCTGSFSPRADNDLPGMIKRYGEKIHCAHLRSTQRHDDGSFYEADHLGGSIDMYLIVEALIAEMVKREKMGSDSWKIPFRPDHGHTMLDDLSKPLPANPGYTAIGRLRGLAEIRGLQMGIARSLTSDKLGE